ncbi:hypothetical protein HOLleu_24525 [Holothuria leucospilota]|uniref:G-protein coupled receptors family 1 profile domain-containing protein n=1 Tax=Holothuria leucospilota TaxID=206669 RepID=A0A9Q1BVJ4_HOLLE|nr:hypothetical protein HOLleu_24525 [Holothuria leucospilota]
MFPNHILRITIWLVCLFSMLGNLFVIVSRIKYKIPTLHNMLPSEVNTKQNAFLVNLAVADFLMGVYLLSIGIADAKFGEHYFLSAYGWRNGVQCKIIGIIGFASNVASLLTLTSVTVERFFFIVFPFGSFHLGSKWKVGICVTIWITSVVIAITPLILSAFVQGVFGFSDVCLGLPVVTVPERTDNNVLFESGSYFGELDHVGENNDIKNLQWIYSQIVYIYFTSACVLIITFCYVAMFISVVASGIISKRPGGSKDDKKAAMKMSIIVGTDLVCWLPVIAVGILSQAGYEISINLFAWLAVVVMPINSAFNPLIYTIPAIQKKRTNEPFFIAAKQKPKKI